MYGLEPAVVVPEPCLFLHSLRATFFNGVKYYVIKLQELILYTGLFF